MNSLVKAMIKCKTNLLATFLLHIGCTLAAFWIIFCVHFGYIRDNFVYILVTFWPPFGYTLDTFLILSGYILATFWLHHRYILATFLLHFGFFLATFLVHSGYMMAIFWLHLGYEHSITSDHKLDPTFTSIHKFKP